MQHLLLGAGVIFGVWVISNEVHWAEPALGLTLLGFSYWVAYQSVQQESSFAHGTLCRKVIFSLRFTDQSSWQRALSLK